MSPIGVPHQGPAPAAGPHLEPHVAAWHDVTCPEGPECRDRHMHAQALPVVTGGVLDRFLARLEEIR